MDLYSHSKTYHWEALVTCCGLMVILCHPDLRKIAFGYFALVVVGPFVILRKLVERRSPQNERNNVSSFSNVLKRLTGGRRKSSERKIKKSKRFPWLNGLFLTSLKIYKRVVRSISRRKNLTTKRTTSVVSAANSDAAINCIVCMERAKNILLLPCKHICLCSNCAEHIMAERETKFCPLCRQDIIDTLEVFI
ncbi:uncharacterized protein LOC101897854 [Musca domestica]|uniref:Probable E3 ubiquitin-protein ligase LUL4 n=1 Tax=Musca domestica TaxID=7370 RepID=A0A1I8MGD4_MUSDO|nr:uncharacterized protein LOC101897854 [Musca domestica]